MRKHLPLLMAALYCSTAMAAPLPRKLPTRSSHGIQASDFVLQKQLARNSAAKGTAVKKRVLATSYTYFGVLNDSNHYYYIGDRGSVHKSSDSYTDNYWPNAVDVEQNILCDSSFNWHDMNGDFTLSQIRRYAYDANNKLTDFSYYSLNFSNEYELTYNSKGLLATLISSDTFGGTPMEPKSTTYVIYNANDRRIKDSTVYILGGITTSTMVYTRDANDNILKSESSYYNGTGLQLSSRTSYTYDASNRVTTRIAEYDMTGTGTLTFFAKDSMAYTGTATQPIYTSFQTWGTGGWENQYYSAYNLNSFGTVSDYTYHEWSGSQYDTLEHDVLQYDADGLLLKVNAYEYDNGGFEPTPYDETIIYYESYFPTAVANTNAPVNDTRIYPNPATNQLMVQSAAGSTITITSISGRHIYRGRLTSNQQTINIEQLQPGNYIIAVYDAQGKALSQQQLSKR